MEQPVGEDLHPDILDAGALHGAQQVVPLQHLVQQDAIEKPAQRKTEQKARNGRATAGGLHGVHAGLLRTEGAVTTTTNCGRMPSQTALPWILVFVFRESGFGACSV
ncbi:hypothetical protein GCM10009099_04140 [Caenispirillum bisanense]